MMPPGYVPDDDEPFVPTAVAVAAATTVATEDGCDDVYPGYVFIHPEWLPGCCA